MIVIFAQIFSGRLSRGDSQPETTGYKRYWILGINGYESDSLGMVRITGILVTSKEFPQAITNSKSPGSHGNLREYEKFLDESTGINSFQISFFVFLFWRKINTVFLSIVTLPLIVIVSQAKYVLAIFWVRITPRSEYISNAKFLFIKLPVLFPILVTETSVILPTPVGANTPNALREKSTISGYLIQLGRSLAVTTTPVLPYWAYTY